MAVLELKPEQSCRYDLISLGEIMLRFDPERGGFTPRAPFGSGKAAVNTMSPAD